MNRTPLILTLDQGTTSSRALVFDNTGDILTTSQLEFPQHFPKSGWVEHDPVDIWNTTLETARDAISKGEKDGLGNVVCIGIANQRETTIVWDKETGETVGRGIVWQDRRTASICARLFEDGWERPVRDKTGLTIDPYFSGTKLRWILDNDPVAAKLVSTGRLAFGTVDSFLIYRLTSGQRHVTDETNASRTLLYNIHEGRWDEDLLGALGISRNMLPEVLPSAAEFGRTDPKWFGREIPILGVAGDQQAAAFGQACWHKGMAKSTYGTGCFLLAHTGDEALKSDNRLLTTVACRTGQLPEYAMEGSIFIAGAITQWLRDELGLIETASDTEKLAAEMEDNQGVYVVPAFTGLGAPHWNSDARGAIYGLTRATNRSILVRAALESVAYQTLDLINALHADGFETARIRVDGGMVANSWFLQFLADILGTDIDRPTIIESTARGAAFLAGLQSGVYSNLDALEKLWKVDRSFAPQMPKSDKRKLISGWDKAVQTTLFRASLDTAEE